MKKQKIKATICQMPVLESKDILICIYFFTLYVQTLIKFTQGDAFFNEFLLPYISELLRYILKLAYFVLLTFPVDTTFFVNFDNNLLF